MFGLFLLAALPVCILINVGAAIVGFIQGLTTPVDQDVTVPDFEDDDGDSMMDLLTDWLDDTWDDWDDWDDGHHGSFYGDNCAGTFENSFWD